MLSATLLLCFYTKLLHSLYLHYTMLLTLYTYIPIYLYYTILYLYTIHPIYPIGILADILEPIMGKGLIPADPATWKIRRRAIVPGFHKAWLNAMVSGK
jgi:hypothetical protein